jgi:hypothetical protein
MADLKTVAYSLNGEAIGSSNRHNKPQDKVSGIVKYPAEKQKDGSIKITYPSGKDWYLFKLVDNNKKGGVYIPNVDDVTNPSTGKVERARLLSGVDSIWAKDQKELTMPYVQQNGRSIEFPRGHKILRIAAHDITMLEYARVCNSNIWNPNRTKSSRFEFFEYDFAMAEQEAFERESFELEMALEAKMEKVELMKKHSAFLGIRLINDIGEKKSDDGIRREYVMYAKRNPQYFKDTKGSKNVEVSWLVRKGISESLIEIGREPGMIYWANGGGMIAAIPQSANPQDYLTELALTNSEEGLRFKENLEKIVT